ncbi:MAG: DUF1015 domain-containing protein, partial [Holosporales bacterium]|jgi:uncharacterized protein (DUF1015 family)|nr:DUF1015 domain-containing protein [Holosporales bacterium]
MDADASFYILRAATSGSEITLIVGEVEYNDRAIFCPTEDTNKMKMNTYSDIFNKHKMQVNPVLTFYNDGPTISELIGGYIARWPDVDTCVASTRYRLWKISDYSAITHIKNEMAAIKRVYIADGNHRFLMFNKRSMKADARIVAAITDSGAITVKSFHRVITGALPRNWVTELATNFIVRKTSTEHMTEGGILMMLDTMEMYELIPKSYDHTVPIYDVVRDSIIHETLKLTDDMVFAVPGNLNVSDAGRIFDLYKGGTAIIFVPNMTMTNFIKIVDSGGKLPPTSTWIEPKIIDGFLVRKY